MDINVRKENGIIVPINGARRLDAMLIVSSEAVVTEVVTFKKITVIRNEYGDIVEKGTQTIKE